MARTKVAEMKRKENTVKAAGTEKKKRRMKWRQKARNEIWKLCRKTEPIFPRATMARLIAESARKAATELGIPSNFRFKAGAIEALREGGESFLHDKLAEADKWCDHAGRVTLFAGKKGDLQSALRADPKFDMHRFGEVMQDFKDQARAIRKAEKKAAVEASSQADPTVVIGGN